MTVKRSTINIAALGDPYYRFINMFLAGSQSGPSGGSWTQANAPTPWQQSIGSRGFPNSSITSGSRSWGSGVKIPPSLMYGDVGSGQYYVFRFQGSGQYSFAIGSGATITLQAGMSTHVTQLSSTSWRTTSAQLDTYMVFNYTGPAQQFGVNFTKNDIDGAGTTGNVRNIAFYRLDDETDYLSGKLYNIRYKQSLINLCPSAVRFMDWCGGNDCFDSRFSNRVLPNQEYISPNFLVGPAYGDASGTNRYTIASVAGMPANHVHGEVVICRFLNGYTNGGTKTIIGITKANPGVVNCTAHGFSNGEQAWMSMPTGMTQLNQVPVTVTVVDADHFSVGVDTTGFTTFTSGAVKEYVSLNVGSRGEYPIVFSDGGTLASNYSSGYIAANDYKTLVFDKTISALTDGAGNPTMGVWTFNNNGNNNGLSGPSVPLEYAVALVNELNAMSPKHPIDMYLNIGARAVLSVDNYTTSAPYTWTSGAGDYSSTDNWALGALNVVLNGANGWAGLTSVAKLLIEYANETWNTGGAFTQTFYLAQKGFLRWGNSTSDYASMFSLRSTYMAENIKSSPYYDANRVKIMLSGQGTQAATGLNASRIDGSTQVLTDPLWLWGSTKPMDHHDYFVVATYFDAPTSFITGNLATMAASWVSHNGNAASQEADCASYVAGIVNAPVTSQDQGVYRYQNNVIPAIATKVATYGKKAACYEGGWDQNVVPTSAGGTNVFGGSVPYAYGAQTSGSNQITSVPTGYVTATATAIASDTIFIYGSGIPNGTTVTAASGSTLTLSNNATTTYAFTEFVTYDSQDAFLRACKRSKAWADTMVGFFDSFNGLSNGEYPAAFTQMNTRWGDTPNTAMGEGATEWGDLSLNWTRMALRNRDLRRLVW